MKNKAFLFALLISASAQAQTLEYQIDTIRLDSFYLIETFTAAPTKDNPRPESRVSPQLFRDTIQLRLFVSNLKKDAKAAAEQAVKYDQAARLWAAKADAISQLANGSDWFMGRKAKVKPPEVIAPATVSPPKKTTTKKKKQ
jgi:hypothetical protein